MDVRNKLVLYEYKYKLESYNNGIIVIVNLCTNVGCNP